MSIISVVSMRPMGEVRAEDHSPKSVALLCCVGLVMSLCLIASGIDLSASWV